MRGTCQRRLSVRAAFRHGLLVAAMSWNVAGLAQESGESGAQASPDSWKQRAADLQPVWDQAGQMRDGGEYVQAAQRYQEILSQLPDSSQAQKAALWSGECFAEAGRWAEAAAMFDEVVAIGHTFTAPNYHNPTGKERKLPSLGRRLVSIEGLIQEALYQKALACRELGDAANGIRAIEQLRLEFPNSSYVIDLVPVYAALTGYSPLHADQRVAAEREASAEFEDAHKAFLDKHYDAALPIARWVIEQYPETAAAVRARADAARMLWAQGEYDQARQLYTDILERGKVVAPNAHLVRLAEAKVAWLDMKPRLKNVIRGHFTGRPAPPEEAQAVYDHCLTIMSKDDEQALRCHANNILIKTADFYHDYPKVIAEAKVFFRNYAGSKKQDVYAWDSAWVHIHAGNAYTHLGLFDEALTHYRAVTRLWETDPQRWAEDSVIPAAFYGIVLTLRERGGPEAERTQIENTIHSNFPQSNYSRLLKVRRP